MARATLSPSGGKQAGACHAVRQRDCTLACSNVAVLYMVVEKYRSGPGPVYERAAAQGRMLPEGLRYIDSWVVEGRLDKCFQLMETDSPELLDAWRARWADLVDFEVFPVLTSREAAQRADGRQPPETSASL